MLRAKALQTSMDELRIYYHKTMINISACSTICIPNVGSSNVGFTAHFQHSGSLSTLSPTEINYGFKTVIFCKTTGYFKFSFTRVTIF